MESVTWPNSLWKSSKENIKMRDSYCSDHLNPEYNKLLTGFKIERGRTELLRCHTKGNRVTLNLQ